MRDDEREGGGEALVAVEGAGLARLLADGAIEALEEAGGAEEARLPGVAAFARPGQRGLGPGAGPVQPLQQAAPAGLVLAGRALPVEHPMLPAGRVDPVRHQEG